MQPTLHSALKRQPKRALVRLARFLFFKTFPGKRLTMMHAFPSFLMLGRAISACARRLALLVLGLLVFLTACVSGGGGGGGGSSPSPAPERVGLFSHTSYDFALLNTTQTGQEIDNDTLDARTLGLIDLEDAEVRAAVRARLPAGSTDYTVAYTIVGGANDLTRAFFTLQADNSARLLFQAAERYNRRAYTLDYVVNTLGIDELEVAANISYVDAAGANQTLGVFTAPVRIRAVAEVPSVNDFLVFEGISRSGMEQRAVTTPSTDEVDFNNGRLSGTTNTTMTKQLSPFTTTWRTANYTADADEPTPAAAFDQAQLLANNQVAKMLNVDVTLTLNNNSAQQVSGMYPIAANTNISTINGNSSVNASFLAFLKDLNRTGTRSAGVSDFVAVDANGNVGPNVTEVAWSFTFRYTADVTTTTTSTENVRVSSRAYTAEGAIAENAAGRTDVGGLTHAFRALGITIKDPQQLPAGYDRVPTLYFRVRNANNSSPYECENAFYLDQAYENYEDYAMKAQAAQNADEPVLDHEHENRSAYACRLEASLRGFGANYTAIRTTNLTDSSNQTTAVSGVAVAGTRNAASCGAAEARRRLDALRTFPGCVYQAGLAIAVEDVNEPVTLSLDVAGGAQDEANIGFAGDAIAVDGTTPLNTSGPDLVLATFTYREQDEDAAGNRLRVDAPVIAAIEPAMVSPTGGDTEVATTELFYIARNTTQADTAHLMLRASAAADVLDYEALPANATGQRGYRVTMHATDNSAAALTTAAHFNLEVRDVVYAPVDVTYMPSDGVNRTMAPLPLVQTLLPGFAQFVANGGPVLGTVRARDPESNTAVGLTYQYVGVSPFDLTRNGSFALSAAVEDDGATASVADELLLVGLGLRDGDVFNITLRAINPSPRANATTDLPVRTVVSYAAARPDPDSAYDGEPPITFNAGAFLGRIAEGQEGVAVRAYRQATNLSLSALVDTSAAAGAAPRFALMTNADIQGLAETVSALEPNIRRALRGRLDNLSDAFTINATDGALSITQVADFTQQPVYTLVARVVNATDAESDDELLKSDYAVVQVVVEDTNTAPRIVELTAVGDGVQVDDDQDRVLFTVAENVASGAALATWTVEDDNPLTDLHFDPATGATAYRIELDPDQAPQRVAATAAKPAHYVAGYRLVTTRPDYEADATINELHQFNDNAQYEYQPAQRRIVPKTTGNTGANATTLRVNGSITNVNEPPTLTFLHAITGEEIDSAVGLNEDAMAGTVVARVRAEDPEGLTAAANLTYTLTTSPMSLAPALNVNGFDDLGDGDDRTARWDIVVANETALDNAGDGQIFTLTVTATEPGAGGLSAREQLAVEVIDAQRFRPQAVDTTLITLSEQQALDDPDRVLRAPLFRFVDVQPDYDEYFFGLSPSETPNPVRFGEVAFAAGGIGYVRADGAPNTAITAALREEETFNLVTLQTNAAGEAADLRLGEARFIEPNLLGRNLTVLVELLDPAGGAAPTTVPVPLALALTRPVGLAFAHAQTNTALEPAAYTFDYTQTAYVAAVDDASCASDAGTHTRIDGRCYPVVRVRTAAGDLDYAARDPAGPQNPFGAAGAAARSGAANDAIGIILTNISALTNETIAIYALDDAGNLQAEHDFATYFEPRVNNSYAVNGVNRTALVLRQRMHAVLDADGSVNPNATYAALDTLPLRNAAPRRALSYLILATDDGLNASRRAIAQVNVDVRVAGVNVMARVTELRLGALDLLNGITLAENGKGETAFDFADVVNSPRDMLSVAVTNPDGARQNQTVNVTVDVVAARDYEGPSDGAVDLAAGTASGHHLIRLGMDPQSNRTLPELSPGAERIELTQIPFQLARNVHGAAFVRVKLVEREGRTVFGPHYQYFRILVRDDGPAYTVANLTVGGLSSPAAENALDALDRRQQLNITLASEDFTGPRQLADLGVQVELQNATAHLQNLMLQGSGAATVMPAPADAGQRYVNQTLTHRQHAHGEITWRLTLDATEPRGFGDTANFASARRFLRPSFVVAPENDPILACGNSTALPAQRLCSDARLAPVDARYTLRTDFGNRNRMMLTNRPSQDALTVYFTDPDLPTGDIDPTTVTISHVGAQALNSSVNIELRNGDNFQVDLSNVVMGLTDGDVSVALPVELSLTGAQYDAISSRPDVARLNVTLTITDSGPGSSVRASTTGFIVIEPLANDFMLTRQIADGARLTITSRAPQRTPIGSNFTLMDDDLRRPSGDTYTYELMPAPLSPVFNFLEWSALSPETIPGPADSATRFIRTTRILTDQDAGVYRAFWSLDDNEAEANGTFTLNVTDVNDPLLVAATPVENATYNLQTEFNANGSLRGGSKNLVFYFTDADLATAANTAARDAAASVANVLDGMPVFMLGYGNGSAVDRATETRLILGAPVVTNPSGNGIRVAVPMDINLTQTQYEDLLATGSDLSFQVNITMADRDVYGATQGTNRSAGSVFLRTGADASAAIPANTYAGGRPSIYREQALVGSQTSDAAAVFLDENNQQLNITLTDRDLGGAGDTYTYAINVTNGTGMPVPNLLAWREASQVPSGNGDNRTGNYIRFEPMGDGTALPRGPQPGIYTVAWSITEARGSLSANREVASDIFTLEILETPAPEFVQIMEQIINEGEGNSVAIPVELESPVPGDLEVSVSSTLFERTFSNSINEDRGSLTPLVLLRPGNVTGLTRPFTVRNASVALSGIRVGIAVTPVFVTETYDGPNPLEDEYVGSHRINVTAYTTDISGNRLVGSVVFNLTVANVNDPLTIGALLPISLPGGASIERGGQATFNRLSFEDFDRRIRGRPLPAEEITVFDSNFQLNFTAAGIAAGVCKIPRARRPVISATTFSNSVELVIAFNLTDCAASDGFVFPAGINNLYELSQRRTTVRITQVAMDDYAELVGPSDATRRFNFFSYSPSSFLPIPFFGAINSVDDLTSGLANYSADVHRLEANLTLTSWTPIPSFTGLFDGNNHTITFASSATGPLFDTIDSGATVTNLGVINSTLAKINEGAISNSYATGDSSCSDDDCNSGGLVGENSGRISYSYATGASSCSGGLCASGGLVGYNNGGVIAGSYAIGNITCTDQSSCFSGGLVGSNGGGGTIVGSYAIGNTTCLGVGCSAAGLVGENFQSAITESYATGNTACFSNDCESAGLIGDVISGSVISAITHTYATGNSSCIGGLCNIGGLVGDFRAGSTLTGSYRAQSAGTDAGDGDTNRTLVQLRCPTTAGATCEGATTYTGWNNTIWNFGTASDLPTLNDLPTCPTFRPNCRH